MWHLGKELQWLRPAITCSRAVAAAALVFVLLVGCCCARTAPDGDPELLPGWLGEVQREDGRREGMEVLSWVSSCESPTVQSQLSWGPQPQMLT